MGRSRLPHLSWTNLGIKITKFYSYSKKLGTINQSSTQQKVIWQENELLQHYYDSTLLRMQLADLHCFARIIDNIHWIIALDMT